MPAGHTERRTINDRRALTDEMQALLDRVNRSDADFLIREELTNAEKNRVRALWDRGLVDYETSAHYTFIKPTDAGRRYTAP